MNKSRLQAAYKTKHDLGTFASQNSFAFILNQTSPGISASLAKFNYISHEATLAMCPCLVSQESLQNRK